ncbi:hypothetical protein LFL96_18445 [Paraburkholderia sp. D15]|uniref:hypothetical protein n=1 Tax=Paraburkholderia sp. D15 TaxID=2880218 RepID=UPI00247AAC32|nr:hypothetical protein [Paraburkholderia sp. D15]WGS49701.1 hypothetical protein LFL96_18445 [Paraburkholderia sp. D15]
MAIERDGSFGGLSGLEAWRVACTNEEMSATVASYLRTHLPGQSLLGRFIASASSCELQERLYRRFHWLTDQPDIETVQRSVDDRIRVLLHQHRRSVALAATVRQQLESRFWQVIVLRASTERRLTFGDLLQQIEQATTAYLPVPVDQISDLFVGARPGAGLLRFLRDKVPRPPSPLIQRAELVRRIEAAVNQRRSIVLTGTVFKGKTTVAQLVANELCPNAWWINLTGRQLDEVDNLLLALAGEIDGGACPALVVIDDLDISPLAHRAYRDSLALVLHRTRASGRAVLISAQGDATESAQMVEWEGIEIIEVPELQPGEVEQLCIQEGCSLADAGFWGSTIHALSAGHPKLVQVRVAELSEQAWPQPTASYIGAVSSASDSVRQLARRLLSESWAPEVVEFLYCASECSVLLHRSVAVKLAESVGGIRNPGDVLERLAGKWLDCVEHDWFRTTPLLIGAAGEAWSPEQRAIAHIRLYDSIRRKGTLSPSEAAALLFHAFVGHEPRRLAQAAMELRILEDDGAREAVERNLLWLPYAALEPGARVIDDAVAGAAFRMLQFSVAITLESETLSKIGTRWVEETERVSHAEMLLGMQVVMWTSMAIASTAKLPIQMRLDAIRRLSSLSITGEIGATVTDGLASFLGKSDAIQGGIPASGTQVQILLAFCARWVRRATTLREFIEWFDISATEELRRDFNVVLEWPFVQTSGAFVQSAWVAEYDDDTDWAPWLELFEFIYEYARRRASPNVGREAAKAKAIVLTEYQSRADEALLLLDAAEQDFGYSAVLGEQRLNVLFQINDYEKVVELWSRLVDVSQSALDPFAYRRAAISAARLGMWGKSEEIFRGAAAAAGATADSWTGFGLLVDCSLAASLGGRQRIAAEILAEAVNSLPASASDEGDERGEALQRAASEVHRRIEKVLWASSEHEPKFQPGYASSPGLRVPESTAGQALRTALTRGQVAKLSACLGVGAALVENPEVTSLAASQFPQARWLVAEAQLAASFADGAGTVFIRYLVQFLAATATIQRLGVRAMERDPAITAEESVDARQWLGLLVAGACCAGPALGDHLEKWLDACRSMSAAPEGLESLVRQLQVGAQVEERHVLWGVVADVSSGVGIRCGAAAKLILDGLPPAELLRMQGWLTSAVLSDASAACQELFNFHLAERFARDWTRIAHNPFQLPIPRTTVPAIKASIETISEGRGTLRTFLLGISRALGQPLGDFMGRVR